MGLKGSGPYFQRSMASVVLAGLDRLRTFNVAANPKKTKLGLSEVEYVGNVVSSEVAQENQKTTDLHRMLVYDNNYTDYPINSLRSINYALNIVDRIGL